MRDITQGFESGGRYTRKELEEIAKGIDENPPFVFEDVPGIGKTAIIHGPKRAWPLRLWRWFWVRVLRRKPYWYMTIWLTDRPPEDFAGIPKAPRET